MNVNKKKSFYLFLCFLYMLCSSVWSQKTYNKYNFIALKGSISKIGVSTIIQDNDEFVWIGTNGMGLYRYDGIDYINYRHELNDSTSISSSLIHCSFLDSKNRLWIGTEGGLNLYDRDHDCFVKVPLLGNQKENKIITSVRCLTEDNKGSLFVGTIGLGLFKLNLENFNVEKIQNQDSNHSYSVNAIQVDKEGKIYTGTNNGLKSFDYNTKTISDCLFKTKNGLKDVNTHIRSLLCDSKNDLWIGTLNAGLFKISKKEENKKVSFKIDHFKISKNTILSIIALSDGTMMCGTENSGLFHLDANGNVLYNYLSKKEDEKSILSNSIWSLFVDRNDRIWMGSYNSGVAVYDKLYDKFKNIESISSNYNSLQVGSVYSMVQDEHNNFWIGTDGGGIDILNTKSHQFIHINSNDSNNYTGLTTDYFQTIFIDSKNNIWAGSWDKGLFFLKNGSKHFINYNSENTQNGLRSNTILSIDEDSEGIIWIGTFYRGLHSYNPKTNKFVYHNSEAFVKANINTADIRKVLIDSNDDLWVGTTTYGLFRITKLKDNGFSVVSMLDKMYKQFVDDVSVSHILSIYESTNHTLWIGTRGSGLFKYDRATNAFTWYNKENGLLEENISAITESLSGDIWLSGNTGITKMDNTTKKFTNFSSDDGLLSNDFNMNAVFRDSKGYLYFGNYKGIDYFNPSQIETNKTLPSLYFTNFKLFNEKVTIDQKDSPLKKVISETKSITLNSKQSVFTIEFSGINYTRPEKNKYAYYLEGYEETWNYVGKNRSATYTNLNPGNYTFKLKAANNDGVWNEKPLTLEITILPPWWKTSWAIFSYVILFLFGIYLLNRITKNRLREKQEISYERNERMQIEELNEKKFQFFTNISHEFRTPLSLIKSPLEDIIRDASLNLPPRIREKHNIIYKNTDRLFRLINELLDFRKLELNKVKLKARKLNLVDFTKDIVVYFKEETLIKNIQLTVDADVSDLSVWADESMLEKIIFNLLSNAIKITPEGGAINIELVSKDDECYLPLVDSNKPVKVVEILISDTGPGLEKDQIEYIFERFYQIKNLNKTYVGGTGIGLEVVKNFVKLHKGKIEVMSEVGRGTTFRIILPIGNSHFNENELLLDKTEVLEQKQKFVTTIAKKKFNLDDGIIPTENNSNTYTLLIVEDNIELRNYLKEELKSQYKILLTNDGKKGIEIARTSLPDIILTDVIMPEMDGFTFCKNIKSDIKTSHIPLLMLTAKSKIDNRMEGIEMGADAYMVKPFDMRLLKLRLSQLITSRQLIFNKYFSIISDMPTNVNAASLDKEFIQKVLSYINTNIGDPNLNVELLASQLNLSRSQFYRKIKALTNQTANEFLRNIRLQKAKQIIEQGDSNISEVCYKIGFSSPSYFSKCFKSYFGLLPTEVNATKS